MAQSKNSKMVSSLDKCLAGVSGYNTGGTRLSVVHLATLASPEWETSHHEQYMLTVSMCTLIPV